MEVCMEELTGISRENFLKGIGAGLGAVALGGIMSANASAAQNEGKRNIIVITSGGNNPNRAILALLMALNTVGSTHVWMTLEGAELAVKAKSEKIESPIFKKFGSAAELMKKLKDKGTTFGVCPPCAEYAGAVAGEKYDFVEKQGADWLMKSIQDATVAWM
jgi:predicted peroxiredoxin